jgi:hypothetical protein
MAVVFHPAWRAGHRIAGGSKRSQKNDIKRAKKLAAMLD